MAFFIYILQSELDGSFYIGYTNSQEHRLKRHNDGLSKYTSRKRPWKIIYTESFETKTEALKREKFLKKQKNSDFYERLINSSVG